MGEMRAHPSLRQEEAIRLLARGETLQNVANALGVRRETLWRWAQEPDFRRSLEESRAASAQLARDRLSGLLDLAVDCLHALLTDPKHPAHTRLLAAREVLNRAGPIAPEADRPSVDLSALTDDELDTWGQLLNKCSNPAARQVPARGR